MDCERVQVFLENVLDTQQDTIRRHTFCLFRGGCYGSGLFCE